MPRPFGDQLGIGLPSAKRLREAEAVRTQVGGKDSRDCRRRQRQRGD
jgi:hypothetical protein